MSFVQRIKRWVGRDGESSVGGQAADGSGDAPPLRVLMVCTGNICRSPIAEGVLRAKLAANGLAHRVTVDSAGTHGYHTSEPPDPRAIRLAAARGYDIRKLKARPVEPGDFESFDWILALDEGHLRWLQKKAPAETPVRMELLMSHARQHTDLSEVPDPYYGPDAGFEHVLDLVEDACDGVLLHLQSGGPVRA